MARLVFGAFVIMTIGILGLTPKTMFGFSIIWPYAALWGAVGWGRVGLSLRPMLFLIAFGLAQDISLNAPLGCFVIVNLSVYGLSAAVADAFDTSNDPILGVIAPTALLLIAFVLVWALASLLQEHPVRIVPLTKTLLITGIGFAVFQKAFNLGRPPGSIMGTS
ncbi:MAG: hypothetical protein ACRBEQ_05410 [Hyphomonas sp.]